MSLTDVTRQDARALAARVTNTLQAIRAEIGKRIVGQDEIVEGTLTCLLAGGHVLLEGVPGLGKTLLVKTLAESLDLTFSRIQFTPDLMPADIVGTNLIVEEPDRRRVFQFQRGPIFGHLILADEVNRATPKTQAALLEAMQEGRVTVGREVHQLARPFFVLATQNPIEMEGTYPLPEAQLDRFFFKLKVRFPTLGELVQIIDRTTAGDGPAPRAVASGEEIEALKAIVRQVPVASHVKEYAARLVLATHPTDEHAPPEVRQYVRHGASPRGAQALVLAAKIRALAQERFNASTDDIRSVALPALRHRIILNFEAEARGIDQDAIVEAALAAVPR
ncbi:MAG TPA: MoxR family ATPase [Thermodesulfobacteriota bacterium]|nr:MoxR family ATPase [Thermodesulfobacteriota bacterium]